MTTYKLHFSVNGGKLYAAENFLAADSINYCLAEFSFDDSWDGFIKTAIFRKEENAYHMVLEDDVCRVPSEVITDGIMYVSVFGVQGDERATTVEAPIQVEKSGYVICEPSEATPDPYNYFIEKATKINENCEEIFSKVSELEGDVQSANSSAQGAALTAIEQKNQAVQSALSASEAEKSAVEMAKKAETAKDTALAAQDTAVMVAKESKEYAESAESAANTAQECVYKSRLAAAKAEETAELLANSKNLFANAIKKTVSGTEEIVIRDVSPIEHTLKCKVSNNKELWPRLTPCQYVKVNDDGTFNIQSEHGFACECDSLVLPAGTYTTSGSVYTYVTDRTGSTGIFYYNTPATFTLEEETTVYIGVTADGNIDVTNQYFRLEEGTVATPYITDFSAVEVSVYGEDGLKQTVTANADGSVEGLMSVAPVMSLMCSANGVNIDVEYIADTKNYVDTAIGEIDTALDGIIAIQNSLIGGEGV